MTIGLLAGALFAIAAVGVVVGRLITGRFAHWVYWDIDIPVRSFAEHHAHARVLRYARRISGLGNAVVTGIVAFVVGSVWAARTRSWRPLLILGFVFAGAGLVTLVVKPVVHRSPQSGPIAAFTPGTFPSGHAITAAAVYGTILWLILRTRAPRTVRVLLAVSLVALTLTIGLARVYLLDHYLSDVVGGYLLGISLIVAAAVCVGPSDTPAS
jgi:undecaprenyl-diphosphatase